MLDGVSVSPRSEQSAVRSMPSALHLQPASHPSSRTTSAPVQCNISCSIKAMSTKVRSCNFIITSQIHPKDELASSVRVQGSAAFMSAAAEAVLGCVPAQTLVMKHLTHGDEK